MSKQSRGRPVQILASEPLYSAARSLAKRETDARGYEVSVGWALGYLAHVGAKLENECGEPLPKGQPTKVERVLGVRMTSAQKADYQRELAAKAQDIQLAAARKILGKGG